MGEDPLGCSECGADLRASARFCSECGAPAAVPGSDHELRKTVTLLFTDVTGSTALGEQLDPEAYRAVMGRYFETARAAVERHGGTVEKFVGDAVLAVFGIPEVREDDALRAVRAAQEMRSDLVDLSRRLEAEIGVRLEVRTGVNTGQVVAGSPRAGGSFATGDAVNTAARLEQAAPPGEVLLGAETYWLVHDAVEVEEVAPLAAKGKAEPVAAYRLLGVLDTDHGRRRRFDGALVGRERESRALVDTLDRTVELQRGHLVTVLGAPGIGKTRLVADFVKDIGDRAQVVSGRCVAYGQGITYWPVVQLLREALHLQGDESTEVTRHALEELLEGAPDRARVGDLLLALLGKDADQGGREETFWAVQRAVEQLAGRRPLVVTVDDLHWAEPTLLQLLEHLRDEVRDLPLLLVCQARPELLDTRPGWGGGSLNSVSLGLEPFTDRQTALSLGSLLEGPVSPGVAEAVADWAGGNPLFVEEVVTHLVERGLLARGDEGWSLVGDLAMAEVPPTVAALLAARLDRLPVDQRTLAERMSVVGLELTEEDAVVLAGADAPADVETVRHLLGALTRRDLLRRRRTEHGEVYAFKHILVRDAAYEALPKALRAELHELYAEHLVSSGDDAAAERTAFVAHHLEQTLRHRSELGLGGEGLQDLAARTAAALVEAGDQAREKFDLPAATRLLQRATELGAAPESIRRDSRLRLLALLFAMNRITSLGAAIETFAEAAGVSASEVDQELVRCMWLWRAVDAGESVDPAKLIASTEKIERLAAPDDRTARGIALRARIDALATLGLWTDLGALAGLLADLGGVFELRTRQLHRVTSILHGSAPISQLDGELEQMRAIESRTPMEELLLRSTEVLAWAAAADPRAAPGIGWLVTYYEQHRERPMPLIFGRFSQQLSGDIEGTLRSARQLADLQEAVGDLSHASTELATVACLELELGDPQKVASSYVDRAASVTSTYDAMSMGLVATARCLLAGRDGDGELARQHAAAAAEAMANSDQEWQRAELLRLAALALRWCDDVEGERAHLEQALELYRHKEIVHWTRVVEARLAELDQTR